MALVALWAVKTFVKTVTVILRLESALMGAEWASHVVTVSIHDFRCLCIHFCVHYHSDSVWHYPCLLSLVITENTSHLLHAMLPVYLHFSSFHQMALSWTCLDSRGRQASRAWTALLPWWPSLRGTETPTTGLLTSPSQATASSTGRQSRTQNGTWLTVQVLTVVVSGRRKVCREGTGRS